MKIIGVIPARYGSTRFPGKPLVDICGKPMIWWVYNTAKKISEFDAVYVATDDERIVNVCNKYGMHAFMTSQDCPNHFYRIWEVSEQVNSNYYISINGDEPLVNQKAIRTVLPCVIRDDIYFGSVYKELTDPAEVIDISNVKIVLGKDGKCLYQSRLPIPSTKGSLLFKYKKAIGIECFNKKALDFYVNLEMGELERIEDIDHLRLLENGVPMYYQKVDSDSISVDTQNDLEKVRKIMAERLQEVLMVH